MARREEKASATTTSAERDELIRLRRENKQLRQERGILSRATAWFARGQCLGLKFLLWQPTEIYRLFQPKNSN
jgi:transposase-like protein